MKISLQNINFISLKGLKRASVKSKLTQVGIQFQVVSLETTTAAAALPARRVGRDGRHVLNAPNLHAGTSERTQRTLRARTRCLGLRAASSAQLDVQRSYAELHD